MLFGKLYIANVEFQQGEEQQNQSRKDINQAAFADWMPIIGIRYTYWTWYTYCITDSMKISPVNRSEAREAFPSMCMSQQQ